MLRQQLTVVIALLVAHASLAVGRDSDIHDMQRAQADAVSSQSTAAHTIDQATALMSEGGPVGEVSKEMRQVAKVQPAALGSIGGVEPAPMDIDIDTLAGRYTTLGAAPSVSGSAERLLVFISTSVPRESLRRLARQAAGMDAPLVLRGVVGGDFTATAEFIRDIHGDREKQVRAMIDPTLFSRFDVRQVPAVVFVPTGACTAGVSRCPPETPAHVHVAGDVTLDYALDYIARAHPEYTEQADALRATVGSAND